MEISALAFDCDGVLTDGRYYYSKAGKELLAFHANDSVAIGLAKEAGLRIVMVSSDPHLPIKQARATDLNIEYYYAPLGGKLEKLLELGIDPKVSAYIGDCLDDIPVFKQAALSFAPADSLPVVKSHASYALHRNGGSGCLLEAWLVIEALRGVG